MTGPSWLTAFIAVAIIAFGSQGAVANRSNHGSPGIDNGPSEACFYTVAPHNLIAVGLEHVLVITDPGKSGYNRDDVKFIFRNSAFTVSKGGSGPSDMVGHVPDAAIQAGVKKARLFLDDCHRVKSGRT
ncbi:MAG TPA: hypothetical protein VFG12_08490 [Rhodopila sp.]|jgi:hypothetical protein|nr:hypothetical protein [Rhodopila sp.]